jgi:hypothetical protein
MLRKTAEICRLKIIKLFVVFNRLSYLNILYLNKMKYLSKI